LPRKTELIARVFHCALDTVIEEAVRVRERPARTSGDVLNCGFRARELGSESVVGQRAQVGVEHRVRPELHSSREELARLSIVQEPTGFAVDVWVLTAPPARAHEKRCLKPEALQ